MSWATIDVAVCYSYGHVYRRAVYVALGLGCAHLTIYRYRNLALMVTVIALGVPVLVLLLNGSCSYNCAFKVMTPLLVVLLSNQLVFRSIARMRTTLH